jgi:hypothetical protein
MPMKVMKTSAKFADTINILEEVQIGELREVWGAIACSVP